MKLIKRFFIFVLVLVGLLAIAAVAIPFFFKDQLVDTVKEEANKYLDATLDFNDVNLSFFRSFPNLSLSIKDISVTGKNEFEGLQLAKVDEAAVAINLLSLINSPMEITELAIEKPKVNLMVLENGSANYNIAKSSDSPTADENTSTSPVTYQLKLSKYSISDAEVIYEDHPAKTYLHLSGLNHSGSGDFNPQTYKLKAITGVESIDLKYDQTKYLKETQLNWDAELEIQNEEQKYTFLENELKINALLLKVDGFIQLLEDAIDVDVKLNAPQNELKNIISLIPDAYAQDFNDIESSGKLVLDAFALGKYQLDGSNYPAFTFNLGIEEGFVKYPDLPLPIENIYAQALVESPGADFDKITVDLPSFGWKLAGDNFKGKFGLKTPISDPDIDCTLDGKIDFAKLKQALPQYLTEDMSGQVVFDASMATKYSTIESGRYDQVNASGNIDVYNLNYRYDPYPLFEVKEAKFRLTPKQVIIDKLDSKAGDSDVSATGTIDNVLAYFSPEKTMTGSIKLNSNYFNVDEWYPLEYESSDETIEFADTTQELEKPFDRFDFNVDATINKVKYDIYELEKSFVKGRVSSNNISIDRAETNIKDSDFKASGNIDNVFDYLYEEGTLQGTLSLNSNFININELYNADEAEVTTTTTADTTITSYEVPLVPDRMDLTINSNIKSVQYADIKLNNILGKLFIQDQAVVMDELKAKGLGGDLLISGQYNTQKKDEPRFSFKYDLEKLDFVESFKQVNTFQKLNPVAEYIEGKYSSSLVLDGVLGENLYPVYSSLNASGLLETIDGLVKDFAPLKSLGDQFAIEEFKKPIRLQNTRNYFELKDGSVEIEPFEAKVDDIDLVISGSHSLDQILNYNIKANIPRAMLKGSGLLGAADKGISLLADQANKLGIKVEESDFVQLGIKITGNAKNPKLGVDVLGFSNNPDLYAETESESDTTAYGVADQIEETVTEEKEKVEAKVDSTLDTLKKGAEEQVNAQVDTLKKKAEEEIKKQVGKDAESKVDSIKKALEKWNPLKKKKKKN
ncbi:MAG: AsmA-like C-terminal region-containing protein [Bacteroidota bacterium]